MGSDKALRVEESLGEGFYRLKVSEAERRQAKHDIRSVEDALIELLRNSRDAGAEKIFVASSREGKLRSFTIVDDGDGIPKAMHAAVFEPRVTTKLDSMHLDRWGVHGRGMALFSIAENASYARIAASDAGLGASIEVVFDTDEVAEKADQSSWPALAVDDEGAECIGRGPHNIIRCCCEFALDEHGRTEVYLGSPAEVVAAIRRYGRAVGAGGDEGDLGPIDAILECVTAQELSDTAREIGLDLSLRNAHRVLSGEVKPAPNVLKQLIGVPERGEHEIDLMKDRRSLKISQVDAEAFARTMERDFSQLGDAYFLTLTKTPRVRWERGRITVIFDVEES